MPCLAPLQRSKPAAKPLTHAKSSRGEVARSLTPAPALHPILQAKLRIGTPDSESGQEADDAAAQVMQMSEHGSAGASIPPPAGQSRLQDPWGEGRPLPTQVREQAEARLGALGPVRLHIGYEARALGKQMGADAFTLGRDVGIGRANWSASTMAGARLLLHELVHVKQSADASGPLGGLVPLDRADSAAERAALAIESSSPVSRSQVAPAPAAMRCRRASFFGLDWEVEHSDLGAGAPSPQLAAVFQALTAADPSTAAARVPALERAAGGKTDLLLRALDFMRDNRGILPQVIIDDFADKAAAFCAGRSDAAGALKDAFYLDLLVAILYTSGPGDLAIHHKSGSTHQVPGLPATTSDFGATGSPTSLQRPAPQRSGRPISGGFPSPLSLTVGFATGARFPDAGVADALIRSAGSQIDAQRLPAVREVSQDLYVLRALRTFLLTDRGKLVAWTGNSGRYEGNKSPPVVNVGIGGGPLDTRSTLVHELMHYVFDKSDSILAEATSASGADHPAIRAIETKFIIIDLIRHGQPPLHAKIDDSFGVFLKGRDFFAEMKTAVASNDAVKLSAAVNSTDFAPTTVASGLLTVASGLKFASGGTDYRYTPDQMRDLAFIWAQNAAIVRHAMNEAISVARRESITLAAAFGRPGWQAAMTGFLRSFVMELQRDPRQGVLGLERRL